MPVQKAFEYGDNYKQKHVTKNTKETINALRDVVHENAVEHGWHSQPREFGTLCMLMVSEICEAFEEHRDHRKPNEVYHVDGKPEGIPIELADCIIRILDYCGHKKIDIGSAIETKHIYNISRSYRHGNKAC